MAAASFRAGRYAAIDVGTVTCRMLVADVDGDGTLRELHREYEIVNLGEGVDASGVLAADAIERAASTAHRYRQIFKRYQAEAPDVPSRLCALATSAARDAKNQDELVRRFSQEGIDLAVIPGALEAQLSFMGASIDFGDERLALVDVGGGSTEVVVGQARIAPDRFRSFNVGCRRVTERFFTADPPSADELEQASCWIRTEMAPFFEQLKREGFAWDRLVAVAGTATSVVSILEEMVHYDSSRVHGRCVSQGELDGVFQRLAALPLEQRMRVRGLDPKRAPVIVAGFLILRETLDLAGVCAYTASESDILQGAIMAAAKNGVFPADS